MNNQIKNMRCLIVGFEIHDYGAYRALKMINLKEENHHNKTQYTP